MIRLSSAALVFCCCPRPRHEPRRCAIRTAFRTAVRSIGSACRRPATYNGNLVIWAHGFQDAGTPVGIPEDQLCFGDVCLPRSHHRARLRVRHQQLQQDRARRPPGQGRHPRSREHLYGPEGDAETGCTWSARPRAASSRRWRWSSVPDVFSAGVAACGPVGNFPFQINYFGDSRATFEYFFPGADSRRSVPSRSGARGATGATYYEHGREADRVRSGQSRAGSINGSGSPGCRSMPTTIWRRSRCRSQDVLRYAVVNLNDAAATLGGFPFDNRFRVYTGSNNDVLLNLLVPRVAADPAAVAAMNTQYATTGVLHAAGDHAAHAAGSAGAVLPRGSLQPEDARLGLVPHAPPQYSDRSFRALQLHGRTKRSSPSRSCCSTTGSCRK